MTHWDVVVVGAGPAGLSAAYTAARAGARTLVLERAEHPRYKTCGGGLIGPSLATVPSDLDIPVRDQVERATFTLRGRRSFTRTSSGGPMVSMVCRDEFDDSLRRCAEAAGAVVRQRTQVRSLAESDGVTVTLADGEIITASTVVGADGSSGITSRYVGVSYDQVDLGLEVELPVGPAEQARWRGRLLIDWGPLPGSYAWVFPKDDLLTVGVIAERGQGEGTRAYLKSFVDSIGLGGIVPRHDSGHLTRCRSEASPLRRGNVVVAGDAAGLLEPWTREGISYALRSGVLAGSAAASVDLQAYEDSVRKTLVPEMRAGRLLLNAFSRRPALFHTVLATPPGWRFFREFCRGEVSFDRVLRRRWLRSALSKLG